MNTIMVQTAMECLGWTLLHFLWQGIVIALVFWCGLRLLPKSAGNPRYLAGCLALLLMAAAPCATFYYLKAQQGPVLSAQMENSVPTSENAQSLKPAGQFTVVVGAARTFRNAGLGPHLNFFLPAMVILWFAGVLFF